MSREKYFLAASVFVALALVLAVSCEQAKKATTPVPTAQETPTVTESVYWGLADYESLAAEGKAIFDRVGCAKCHGPDGKGTDLGPALAGHNRSQVLSQVRNPLGSMPPFTPSQLSREEVELVAVYIESLSTQPGAHAHSEWVRSADPFEHLLMAVIALEYGNPSEAQHHIGHALQFADSSPDVSKRLGGILLDIGNGQFLRAQYQLETFVLEMSPEKGGVSTRELFFRLALNSLENGAITAALHLDHLLPLVDAQTGDRVQQVIDLLSVGDWNEAYQRLKSLAPSEGASGE